MCKTNKATLSFSLLKLLLFTSAVSIALAVTVQSLHIGLFLTSMVFACFLTSLHCVGISRLIVHSIVSLIAIIGSIPLMLFLNETILSDPTRRISAASQYVASGYILVFMFFYLVFFRYRIAELVISLGLFAIAQAVYIWIDTRPDRDFWLAYSFSIMLSIGFVVFPIVLAIVAAAVFRRWKPMRDNAQRNQS